MVKSFRFTNHLGESLTVTLKEAEPDHGLLIRNVDGLGPVKAQINDTELVTMDGARFNSARRLKRNLVFDFLFSGEDVENVRYLTYSMFPEKKYITVVVETDTRRASASGYIEHNEPTIFSDKEGCQVSIICEDPNFYDTKTGTQVTSFFGVEPLFEFPFENNSLTEKLIEFGNISQYREKVVAYDGEVEIGMLIRLHCLGPIGDLTIFNLDTKESMKLLLSKIQSITGTPIDVGDQIMINTVRTNPYVRLLRGGVTTNVINILDKNSTWFELSKGDNTFAFEATSGDTNVQLIFENRVVYRGV